LPEGGADIAENKNKVETDKFTNKWEYALSCIGFAVGFGNVWRFPFLCYKLGGLGFLIPYLTSFFLIAIPMFLIETAYGQLIDMKLHHRWGAIAPKMWGLKLVQVFICFFLTTYYVTLMAWSFSLFFASFVSPFPWVTSDLNATVAKLCDGNNCTDAEKTQWSKVQTFLKTTSYENQGKTLDELKMLLSKDQGLLV